MSPVTLSPCPPPGPDIKNKRNPRLVPYHLLDERTKKTNRDSLCQAVRTLLGYGFNIEPPDQESSSQSAPRGGVDRWRVFRAERGYAARAGKWYFEFEAVTTGDMRVGWARPQLRPDVELGADDMAYVFNGHRAQRWHVGSEPFGRPWQAGASRSTGVGCLIDLGECHMSFTLNGEMLISDAGSEVAFRDFDVGDGFVPVCSVGQEQEGRLNLGQDVGTLRFFSICGLQEGFEPFAVNMKRPIALWFTKSLPQFETVPPDHPQLEVTRMDGTPAVPSAPRLEEDVVPDERDDPEVIMNTTTVRLSVRIFAGQEPSSVWVGWVTPDFHQHDPASFELSRVRTVTVTMGDDRGNVHDSIKRSNCYMVWGGEFASTGQQARVSHSDLEINTFFQVEPNTKLFPAVFALPTSQNVIQFELGKLKNIMPISAAMFSSERKNPEPQCPPRLAIQALTPVTWSRMPNEFLAVETTRLGERQGWGVECTQPLVMMALHIPEENRCLDILELSERQDLLRFQWHTLKLYCAVCALGNNRVAHALCSHVDQAQLLFAIESAELPGPLRAGYYDLLLAMLLDAAQRARASMSAEFIIPMTDATKAITLFPGGGRAPGPPGVGPSACLRPQPHFAEPCFVLAAGAGRAPLSPGIPLGMLGTRAIRMLAEAVAGGGPPLGDADVRRVLRMIEPRLFGDARREPPAQGEEEEEEEEEEARRKAIEAGEMEEEERERKEEEEEEDGLEEGLLQMKLPESVKLEMCNLLQYFCERELQHRVEAIVAFSERHVERLQRDQRRRYGQLMRAMTMSAAETARRTREFRSPPQEQVNMLLQYKGGADEEDCPVPEDIRDELLDFHNDLLAHCGIELVTEEEEEEEEASLRQRLLGLEPPAPSSLQELISQTMVHWAQESFIQSPELVRAMFSLLHRQYDGLGELCRALPKAYSISARSVPDTQALLQCLGQIRSLLIVQMGPEEEMLMIQSIGCVRPPPGPSGHPWLTPSPQQHPLVTPSPQRAPLAHPESPTAPPGQPESLMGTTCRQQAPPGYPESLTGTTCRQQAPPGYPESPTGTMCPQRAPPGHPESLMGTTCPHPAPPGHPESPTGTAWPHPAPPGHPESPTGTMCPQRPPPGYPESLMGTTCPQQAPLGYPESPTGTTCPQRAPPGHPKSPAVDNNELALALKEQDLEKVVTYLASCGLQSCPMLLAKGYPDIGWRGRALPRLPALRRLRQRFPPMSPSLPHPPGTWCPDVPRYPHHPHVPRPLLRP
ncbi:ryanodine receptor 1-like [Columba livia]|uniref:Ryanodine receptor 1-like n=1 Tax=Columba livia TaxID=8932 RepID=A0A2I0LIQ5_COLLI|nr:ryanodine receptor 1-like [Columba livia]